MTNYLRAVRDLWDEQADATAQAEYDGQEPGDVCVIPGDTPREQLRNLIPEIRRRVQQPPQ